MRGEYLDLSSGTYYLRARNYDPTTGRFLTEDPIRDGVNWYIYAGNNLVMYIDPSGLVYLIAWSYGNEETRPYMDYYGNIDNEKFEKGSSFARAAYTSKQELLNAGIPESVDLQRIDSLPDLEQTWNMGSKYDKVDRLDIFSHGSKTSALITPDPGTSTTKF